jgi:hypothetical protein
MDPAKTVLDQAYILEVKGILFERKEYFTSIYDKGKLIG